MLEVTLLERKNRIMVNIVTRNGWGAKPPTSYNSKIGQVDTVFIHHTVTQHTADPLFDTRNVQNVAFGRGFSDISYTLLVHPDGTILEGRIYDGKPAVGAHTKGYNSTNPSSNVPKIDMKGYTETLMSYYNFFVLLLIPIFALTSYIIFIKKGHNFFEHLVFNSYLQSNLGFISLVLQVILVNVLHVSFTTYSSIYLLLFIIFTLYAFKKLYNQNFKQSVASGIKYLLLFFGLYIAIMIGFSFIFFFIAYDIF